MKQILFLFCLLCTFSCDEEADVPPASINEELKPYVDRFYQEAENRGVALTQDLDAFIQSDITACGQGHSPDFNGMFDRPTILINEECWNNNNDISREILVFHELGHALLNRIHVDGVLPNGHSKSIMCAGANFTCSDLPDYQDCPEYKEYYLDEMFDQNTTEPEWSTRTWEVLSTISTDYNEAFTTDWQIFTDCSSDSYQVSIDSTDENRPSDYSLRLFSECGDAVTVRRRLDIDNSSGAEGVRLKCDLYQELTGSRFRFSLFVKEKDNSFSTFNRTIAQEIIGQNSMINDFMIQAECLTMDADSLIFDLTYFPNTVGEVFIGNLEVELVE